MRNSVRILSVILTTCILFAISTTDVHAEVNYMYERINRTESLEGHRLLAELGMTVTHIY